MSDNRQGRICAQLIIQKDQSESAERGREKIKRWREINTGTEDECKRL